MHMKVRPKHNSLVLQVLELLVHPPGHQLRILKCDELSRILQLQAIVPSGRLMGNVSSHKPLNNKSDCLSCGSSGSRNRNATMHTNAIL